MYEIRGWLKISFLIFALGYLAWGMPAGAQSEVSQLVVTGSDASSAPSIELYLYGWDSQGNAVDLSALSFEVRHDGEPVGDVTVGEPVQAGTFTVFLIDIPSGVAPHLPAVQQSIQQYASEPTMVEEVDYVALYTVDELAATQLMKPEGFRNSVQNVFANPLTTKTGPTALIDSAVGLLNNLPSLKPRPEMVTHLVIMSDGTDAVSTQFEAGDLPKRAAELGIPVHTVWLNNSNIASAEKQEGQEYLAQIAAGTSGTAMTLSIAEDLQPLWAKIAAFRQQTVIRYTVENLLGGTFLAEVGLAENPSIRASTTVTVPPAAPSVVINIPPESRQMTLPDLDRAVSLSFSTTVSWLDGVERQIEKAQLLVNGSVVKDIDVGSLDQFDAEISNFVFGTNRVQIAVVDDQGGRATSAEIVLTIDQGEEQVPEAVAPPGLLDRVSETVSQYTVYIGGCIGVIFLLILFAVLAFATRRFRLLQRLRLTSRLSRVSFLRPYMSEVREVERMGRRVGRAKREVSRYKPEVRGTDRAKKGGPRPVAFLEVLESNTHMASRLDLEDVEMRLGRSQNQAEIVFDRDSTVSRVHASIVREGNDYRVFDEQSTSGTWVNEQRVPQYGLQLQDGDEIRLGAVRLRFRQP